MLEFFVSFVETVAVCVGILMASFRMWKLIGGKKGLANPWVGWPFIVGSLAFFVAILAAGAIDLIHSGTLSRDWFVIARNLSFGGFIVFFLGLFLTTGTLFGRALKIADLLDLPFRKVSPFSKEEPDASLRLIAESRANRPAMEMLLPLVEQTQGVPRLEWLTPQWVRDRLAVLPKN